MDDRGRQAAELGPQLHGVLRLHPRGPRRGGRRSLEQKLRAIGLPVLDLPRFPMPMDLPPRERALRGQKLLRANLIGPGDGPVSHDPEAVAILFDSLARQADPAPSPPARRSRGPSRTRRPWHLVLDPGGSAAVAGARPDADLTLRCRFADWADVFAGRVDPRAADAPSPPPTARAAAGAVGAAQGLRVEACAAPAIRHPQRPVFRSLGTGGPATGRTPPQPGSARR